MRGFGVNTFILQNDKNEMHFVKFHWKPKAGSHSLVWDEALKINGQGIHYLTGCDRWTNELRSRLPST